jgi:hypothetical protein
MDACEKASLDGATAGLQRDGVYAFPEPVDASAASSLLCAIKRTRTFDASLFLTQEAFEAAPQYRGVNPAPGRNVLEGLADRLGFVEQAPQVRSALQEVLGDDYAILDRKVVVGIPDSVLPGWIRERIRGNPVNNLGCFIRPEFRDITYFYGIDFHQDLIDYRERQADFVTLYVYLHEVGAEDAPLFVLEASHQLGASVFPHALKRIDSRHWLYRNPGAGEVVARQRVLTGPAGYVAMWHACTLHGTQPDESDKERISLRYIFERRGARGCGVDQVNAALKGPLSLTDPRVDLCSDGAAAIKHNAVLRA